MTLWSLLSLLLFEMVTASHLLVHFFALSGKKQCTSGTFSMPYSSGKLLLKNGPLIFMLLNIISLYLEAIRSDYFYEVCHLII